MMWTSMLATIAFSLLTNFKKPASVSTFYRSGLRSAPPFVIPLQDLPAHQESVFGKVVLRKSRPKETKTALDKSIMVKPLSFKGDKKPKKRKAPTVDDEDPDITPKKALVLADQASTTNDDDSWVTAEAAADITGPIILALPSDPPSCIACDATGKVFTSRLENIVEGDLATAEPHDVRQVWVANKVAGTENISFKGHHGRYLSCDQFGILSATHEAISPEESFLCVPDPDTTGTFHVQTAREKFLSVADAVKGPEIRGDAETISFNTTLRIRMQARFKPRLKANKESKAKEKISRKELEEVVGRRLEDEEVRRLKKARARGDYHEAILDVRVKGKHDKYS